MKSYEVKKNGEESLLVTRNASDYVTTVIDRGTEIEIDLDEQFVEVIKANGLSTYYWADENAGILRKLCENVSELIYLQDDKEMPRFLYRKELEYFFMDLSKGDEIALGSYLENNMFLSRMENGAIKTYFFMEDELFEKVYQSLSCLYRYARYVQLICGLREDGLYDVFEFIEDLPIKDDINISSENEAILRAGDNSYGKIFSYDQEKEGYVQVFEGKNALDFRNAVLEETLVDSEKTISRLYFFEGTEKILLAESSDEVEINDYSVKINGQTWKTSAEDYYLLNREPEEEEPQTARYENISISATSKPEEAETESAMLDNDSWSGSSCAIEPEDEKAFEEQIGNSQAASEEHGSVLRVGGDAQAEKKKKGFWSRIFGK